MIPSLDTIHILRSLGYEGTIYLGHDPDADGLYLSIRDTPSSGSNPKWARDFLRIQIRSKASLLNYVEGYNELDEVKNLLFGVQTIRLEQVNTDKGEATRIDEKIYQNGEEITATVSDVIRTVDYIRYLLTSDIQFISLDENNRPIHTVNFEIVRDWNETRGNREPIN